MEMHITKYLCKTADTFDISELVFVRSFILRHEDWAIVLYFYTH